MLAPWGPGVLGRFECAAHEVEGGALLFRWGGTYASLEMQSPNQYDDADDDLAGFACGIASFTDARSYDSGKPTCPRRPLQRLVRRLGPHPQAVASPVARPTHTSQPGSRLPLRPPARPSTADLGTRRSNTTPAAASAPLTKPATAMPAIPAKTPARRGRRVNRPTRAPSGTDAAANTHGGMIPNPPARRREGRPARELPNTGRAVECLPATHPGPLRRPPSPNH